MNDVFDGWDDARHITRGPESGRSFGYYVSYWQEVDRLWNRSPAAGGGGGIGLLFIFVGVVWVIVRLAPIVPRVAPVLIPDLAFAALVLAISAATAGVVVREITRLLARDSNVAYSEARRASLAGLWRYVALTAIIRIVFGWYRAGIVPLDDLGRLLSAMWQTGMTGVRIVFAVNDVSLFAASAVDRWPGIVGTLLVIRAPGIVAFARVLSRRIRGPYQRFSGFVIGTIVAIVTVEVSLSLGVWISLRIWQHVHIIPFTVDERPSILLGYSALLLLPCAFIGGLPGGAIVLAFTRWLTVDHAVSYGRSYSTAVRVLLVYGFWMVVAVLLFRDADGLVSWLAQVVFGRGPRDPELGASTLAESVAALLVLQLPGLLAAGRVIARRDYPVYEGALAYAKACGVAWLTCLAIGVPFWAAALRFLPGLVIWVNSAGPLIPR
jgi:hypothetical protein